MLAIRDGLIQYPTAVSLTKSLAECLREIDATLPIHVSGSHGTRLKAMPADVPTLFKPFNVWDLIDEAEKLIQERDAPPS